MVRLTTDSPICRRIVLSFLDFIKSVKPTPDADLEGLEVVRECLEDVFKLNSSSDDNKTEPGLLVKYFSSMEANGNHDSILSHAATIVNAPSTSSAPVVDGSLPNMPIAQDIAGGSHTSGTSTDELFSAFIAALDNIHFFSTPTGAGPQLDRATSLFHAAVRDLEQSGCQAITSLNLAEAFKSQGNLAMQSQLYRNALELYTCAIALCQNNSVYYCNRAAAFSQMKMYVEAICDCEQSIRIDPNYIKAYSRLGLAYYGLGNYRDAIDKGFMKALQLDPDNDSVKENIRVAEQKLRDLQGTEQQQNQRSTNSSSNHESADGQARGRRNFNVPPFTTSTSFNPADLRSNIADMFMNMNSRATNGSDHEPTSGQTRGPGNNNNFAGTTFNIGDLHSEHVLNMFMNMAGQHPEGERADDGSEASRSDDEPAIRIPGASISVNFGDLPEEFFEPLNSVLGMFSGGGQQQPPNQNQNPQGDTHRGPTQN